MWYNNFQNESGHAIIFRLYGRQTDIMIYIHTHIYVMDEIYYQRKYMDMIYE